MINNGLLFNGNVVSRVNYAPTKDGSFVKNKLQMPAKSEGGDSVTPIEFTNQLNDMVQDAMFHAKQFEQVKDMQNKSTLAEMLLKDMRNMIDLALTFPLESTSESFRKDWKEYQQEVKRLRRQHNEQQSST